MMVTFNPIKHKPIGSNVNSIDLKYLEMYQPAQQIMMMVIKL